MRHFTTFIPSLKTDVRLVVDEGNAIKARRKAADFMRDIMGGARPFHLKEETGMRNPPFTGKLGDIARHNI